MSSGSSRNPTTLAELDEGQRAVVMRRWAVLRPVVQDDVPLTVAARAGGVPLRSAQRWLEGLALQRPRPGVASITRWAPRGPRARLAGPGLQHRYLADQGSRPMGTTAGAVLCAPTARSTGPLRWTAAGAPRARACLFGCLSQIMIEARMCPPR